MINRTQALVLGFFVFAWGGLVVILAVAPEIYDQALQLPPGDRAPARVAFLTAVSVFIVLLATGVLRRWRWTFWLITVAFILGVLRVPASVLELTGVLPAGGPSFCQMLWKIPSR